ncbi:hypothetical protein DLM45_04615 [Hyphomicrobium methylovorum]|nr:hypothetical protein [Hyphomicrobium methylovorum]
MTGPFELDPDLAKELGLVTNAWSHLESNLTTLFCILSKLEMHVAAAIFDLFKSTPTQREALLRLAHLSPRTGPHMETIKTLLKDYQKLAERRNEVAHNPFGVREQAVYIMLKTKGKPGRYGIPYDTRNISSSEIKTLREDVSEFMDRLMLLNLALIEDAKQTALL